MDATELDARLNALQGRNLTTITSKTALLISTINALTDLTARAALQAKLTTLLYTGLVGENSEQVTGQRIQLQAMNRTAVPASCAGALDYSYGLVWTFATNSGDTTGLEAAADTAFNMPELRSYACLNPVVRAVRAGANTVSLYIGTARAVQETVLEQALLLLLDSPSLPPALSGLNLQVAPRGVLSGCENAIIVVKHLRSIGSVSDAGVVDVTDLILPAVLNTPDPLPSPTITHTH